MAGVEASGLTKRFDGVAAVDAVDLAIEDGEFVAVLGPSGCGKTTLLRLVAGFETPDAGTIAIGGHIVSRAGWTVPPEERGIGMVFQSYALWPHMSAAENVAFPLRVRRVPADERRQRVEEALALVGLTGFGERRPSELSGGQRQRVALARCLAMRPALVLLDEPLANLDAHLREQMQSEIRRIHRDLGLTFLYVTHDQAEAMGLADRVVVMDGGRLQQAAEPVRLYNEPATEMVARFIGRGAVVAADILGPDEDRHRVAAFGMQFRARGNGVVPGAGVGRLCLRPPDLRLTTAPEGFAARIVETRFQGATTMLTIAPTHGPPETTLGVEHRGPAPAPGAEVRVAVDDAWLIPGHPK